MAAHRKQAEDYSAWSTRVVPHRIDVYIGDGATLTRSLIRRRAGTRIGHAPVARQLHWCYEARVQQAVFTHCGSQIVRSDARRLNFMLRAWAGSASSMHAWRVTGAGRFFQMLGRRNSNHSYRLDLG
jgi:hypothetical protein